MHKIERKTAPNVFLPIFQKQTQAWTIKVQPPKLKACRCRISLREPYLWNNSLTHKQKDNLDLKFQVNLSYFSVENKVTYF